MGGPESLVNDCIKVNDEGREETKEMKVGEKLKSDNMPLEMKLWERVEEDEKEKPREKTDWSQEGLREYISWMKKKDIQTTGRG